MPKLIKNYLFSILLISSIVLGGFAGHFFSPIVVYLKPIGVVFLNLIFTAIVPLIFFSLTSVIARSSSMAIFGRTMRNMVLVFLFTSSVAALYALAVVMLFPPAEGVSLSLTLPDTMPKMNVLDHIVGIFTVPTFYKLFSHQHILALIIFSMLVGIAALNMKKQAQAFTDFLQAGELIFMRVFSLIMYLAPIGFFAYFAVLVSELGPELMQTYLRISIVYYVSGIIYCMVAYSLFAYMAAATKGPKLYWSHILLPMITSIATCSSAASIPANLIACKNMNVPDEVYEPVIPLGAIIHKDGSVLGGVFKIAFLFGVFHMPFSGLPVLLTALGVSLLVGTVMGAIPSGGMLGELLILTVYGFPPSVLIAIAAISILIDPLATMISVTGNTVSAMLIARLSQGKNWMNRSRDD